MSAEANELITRCGAWRPDPQGLEKGFKLQPFGLVRDRVRDMAGTYTDEHIIPEYTPVSNQGGLGTCALNAWADMLEMLYGLELKRLHPDQYPLVQQLSRLFLYWITRCYLNEQNLDKGTYLRLVALQISTVGICPEEVWPYVEDMVYVSPPLEAFTMASDNKITSVYSIASVDENNDPLDDMEAAVRVDHPVAFGTDVGQEFCDYRGGGKVFTGPPSVSKGGHAMLVTGVRVSSIGREWLWRNSWSEGWGDTGHVWVSDGYMRATHDQWVGVRMKELVL